MNTIQIKGVKEIKMVPKPDSYIIKYINNVKDNIQI